MAKIHISKPHHLDQDSVRANVQELADALVEKLSAEYRWENDRLVFKRSGASGFVRIGDQEIEVEIILGLMLTPLKGNIEKTITEYLEQRLS